MSILGQGSVVRDCQRFAMANRGEVLNREHPVSEIEPACQYWVNECYQSRFVLDGRRLRGGDVLYSADRKGCLSNAFIAARFFGGDVSSLAASWQGQTLDPTLVPATLELGSVPLKPANRLQLQKGFESLIRLVKSLHSVVKSFGNGELGPKKQEVMRHVCSLVKGVMTRVELESYQNKSQADEVSRIIEYISRLPGVKNFQ